MTITPAHEIPLPVRRKAIAVHEAGHALVAILLKRTVTEALLRPPHGLSGETRFAGEAEVLVGLNVRAHRPFIEDAAVILLAGQVAEAAYWKKLTPLYAPRVDSHRTDVAEIHKLHAQLDFSPEQAAMFLGYCVEKTERIVFHQDSQAAIEEIATKLAECLFINRAELDEILERHAVVHGKFRPARHPWQR